MQRLWVRLGNHDSCHFHVNPDTWFQILISVISESMLPARRLPNHWSNTATGPADVLQYG